MAAPKAATSQSEFKARLQNVKHFLAHLRRATEWPLASANTAKRKLSNTSRPSFVGLAEELAAQATLAACPCRTGQYETFYERQ
jgi:hypothetical protein